MLSRHAFRVFAGALIAAAVSVRAAELTLVQDSKPTAVVVIPNRAELGAGVQLGAPASDIDGKPRPTNGGVDIGIYQR